MILDAHVKETVKKNKNLLVAWYLMASYAYYIRDETFLSDTFFDELCRELLAHYSDITHQHKHLVSEDNLIAGTGYTITNYPEIVKGATERLLKEGIKKP